MMKHRHCVVIVGGDIDNGHYYREWIETADFVIAADSGARHLRELGLKPDILLGDFDSIDSVETFRVQWPEAIVESFPARKDFTDAELAVRRAIEIASERITVVGCIGSRMDHTLATLFLLKQIHEAGIEGMMLNEKNRITYVCTHGTVLGKAGETVSIVPVHGDVYGITIHGFEYPLENATLRFGSSTGVSNILIGNRGDISIRRGSALVFVSRD